MNITYQTDLRHRGIARTMLDELERQLNGQHVYRFSDDHADACRTCGYRDRPVGLEKVMGTWLQS